MLGLIKWCVRVSWMDIKETEKDDEGKKYGERRTKKYNPAIIFSLAVFEMLDITIANSAMEEFQ